VSRLVGIWDYNVTQNILQWDKNMSVIFGAGNRPIVGNIDMFSELLHPADKDRVVGLVMDTINGVNDFYDAIYTVTKQDGSEASVHAWGSMFNHNGDKCLIGACEDVTDRKKFIEELRRV